MYVIKRAGNKEEVSFDKIAERIKILAKGLHTNYVDYVDVAKKVVEGLYNEVTTEELDQLASQVAVSMSSIHPDYGVLASRISISNLHKKTNEDIKAVAEILYKNINENTGELAPLITKELYECIQKNHQFLNGILNHEADYKYDYFGFKTLEKSYLLKSLGHIIERPQHMLMRVALAINNYEVNETFKKTYEYLSNHKYTHASPTLFQAGTPLGQLASCFLLQLEEDSMDGIFNTLKECANISKHAGGIGLHVHNLRAKGSYIKGTGGTSNGLVPTLKIFNETARMADQGGGRRKGAFSIYLEPWHADIFEFLDLRKNHGKEEMRARDLFLALWVPDLFMERVEEDGVWSLMCPNESKGLSDVYGDNFKKLYEKYEKEGKFKKQVKARELWNHVLDSQIETGTPYMLYKDACNEKSNQKNLGTIKSSNLCTEILEVSTNKETAVCNLASINLKSFVLDEYTYDFEELGRVTEHVTTMLNKVINVNKYPSKKTSSSNLKHRPIGIGVQGLANVFMEMRLPFDSEEAKQLNKAIFECIYYHALKQSMKLSICKEGYYATFKGSPASEGILQFDLWGVKPSETYNWNELKENIKIHGLRNSLLIAPMPTASTSQILGNIESFEPMTSNIYTRRTLSGEFMVVNHYLINDLINLGLWDETMKQKIINANGSIQGIDSIPVELKKLYKTTWEISQKDVIDMSADRGAYVCQSQSLNIHMKNPNHAKLSSMHFYGWKKGLKTGMYYLRSNASTEAIKFTVDKSKVEPTICSLDDESCISCSG